MQARQEQLPISTRRVCSLLHVNRASLYRHIHARRQLRPSNQDQALREAIDQIVLVFAGYGYRRVTKALQRAGWIVNRKRVLRLMRQEGLLRRPRRRSVRTTNARHPFPSAPNLLDGHTPEGPDQGWLADFPSVRLPQEFVYLACLIDAYSRRCIGWHLSRRMDANLVSEALHMAMAHRDPMPGWIHHSDRGVQYASIAYQDLLAAFGARVSMSAHGNAYDNATAQSFFTTVKGEEGYVKHDQTFQAAERNLGHFLEAVYNTKRLHSSLGSMPPLEFEMASFQQALL